MLYYNDKLIYNLNFRRKKKRKISYQPLKMCHQFRMKSVVLVVLLACLYNSLLSAASDLKTNKYCVSENKNCASLNGSCVECQPLMWFVNRTQTIQNYSRIIFLPGNHSLNSSKSLISFYYKENLTLEGTNHSTVVCSGNNSGLIFRNSSAITILKLAFKGCKANMPKFLYGGVFFNYTNNISLTQVSITNCKGYGLHIGDSCGDIKIEESHFTGNKDGNTVFWFKHCRNEHSPPVLTIHNSYFQNGTTHLENATGLHLKILRGGVTVELKNLTLDNNRGGNIEIQLVDFARNTSSVTIDNCTIENGNTESSGAGMKLWFEKNLKDDTEGHNCNHTKSILTVFDTTFRENRANTSGGGVLVSYHERPGTGCTIRKVEFIGCSFSGNKANRSSAIEISKHRVLLHQVHNVPQFSVFLNSCTIENNKLFPKGDQSNEEGTVQILSVENFVIFNCNFTNNNGTALMLVNSGVQLLGETIFQNNSAEYGGAIKLCDSSVMYFENETRVIFLNNSATSAGGAIYAGNQCLQETPPCFFQISFNDSPKPLAITDLARGILYFKENHAQIAGHAIYGGSVDNCFTDTQLGITNGTQNISYYYSHKLYKQIFDFSNKKQSSLVTSDPYGVCECNNSSEIQLNCSRRNNIVKFAFPGEKITLKISAVGQTEGSVPSQISVEKVNGKTFNVSRFDTYSTQSLQSLPLCQRIVVAVSPQKNVTNVVLKIGIRWLNSISERSNYYRIPKLTVTVAVRSCPYLFKLNSSNICDCEEPLRRCNVQCSIITKTVKKPNGTGVWIGHDQDTGTNNGSNSSCIAASIRCQENRCSNKSLILNKSNLSEICEKEREGRLCGKCKSNYSLSLGMPNCITTDGNCSIPKLLLLLFAFFLAGILLVCFLSFFNLTVTEGTISGLLFYANCIHANQKSFQLPPNDILYSFISWLNLDFGFQVCLHSGMTAYMKVWYEFGFLLYLLLLGVLIVCLSRRSIRFTRLIGHNMVPVLSTIILIAYPKLVRNSFKIWFCTNDKYWSSNCTNSTLWIWHSDETIDCFSGIHLILFAVSIPLFAIALLYTLCLLFIQCLRRGSGWCVLRWVNKLRPFFDANTGPCRDHYQFWPGFLLFLRLLFYIIYWRLESNLDSSKGPYIMLGFCILIFFLACVSPKGVYKKWPLNLLEFSFLLNLGIATGAVSNHYHKAYGYTSISIALFTFLLILAFHTYQKLKQTRRWKRMMVKIRERSRRQKAKNQSDVESSPAESAPLIHHQRLPSIIRFNAPREPLLEDD